MKKTFLNLFATLVAIVFSFQLKAQTGPCETFENCNVQNVCKDIYIGSGFLGECKIKICVDRMVVCGPENQSCQVYAPACSSLDNIGSVQQICYPDILPSFGCNCTVKTIGVKITREYSNGGTGIYNTVTITGTDAQDFENVLNGVPGSSANFTGKLDNCDGTGTTNYAFSFVNGVLSALKL
jgi:hypothetical protein